jgi:putative Mg2+ transporter-C (MgtC) family protein
MPVTLDWSQITLRLALTVAAGLLIGFNREEHGRPAGMRTTLLVTLAASIAMIQTNLLINTVGKAQDSFVTMDVLRLPLGILCGMGFIGAGAILRRDNRILGLTTAATLWFATVMGLCFGGGQISLGIAAAALAFAILWGLKYVEKTLLRSDARATLVIQLAGREPSDDEIRRIIEQAGRRIIALGVTYKDRGNAREICCELEWRPRPADPCPPAFVTEMANRAEVSSLRWLPQGVPRQSAEFGPAHGDQRATEPS